MFGILVEVILIHGDTVTYLEEVPLDVLVSLQNATGHDAERLIVVNLEYGEGFSGPGNDVFSEDRATGDPVDAHNSNFLHPVLYYYDMPIKCKKKIVLCCGVCMLTKCLGLCLFLCFCCCFEFFVLSAPSLVNSSDFGVFCLFVNSNLQMFLCIFIEISTMIFQS